jgi:hypothetical protein
VNTEQIRVLELQAKELQESLKQRQRETLERRSAQASQVFVWQERTVVNALGKLPEHTVTVHLRNTSKQPVYDIWFTWQSGDTKYSPTWREKPLMPDETDFQSAPVPADADPERVCGSAGWGDAAVVSRVPAVTNRLTCKNFVTPLQGSGNGNRDETGPWRAAGRYDGRRGGRQVPRPRVRH